MKDNKDDHKPSKIGSTISKPETVRERAKRKWRPGLTERDLKNALRKLVKDRAVFYSELGWSVIPIEPNGKKPLIRWKKYQTQRATRDQIEEWWRKWPDAQIGIVTGSISNLTVVDFDAPEAKNAFESKICAIPKTLMQKTGRESGGFHALFSYPSEGIRTSHSKILKKIDIKGERSYFIISPSKHKSGTRYKWIDIDPLDEGLDDLSELPSAVLEWARDYAKAKNEPVRDRTKLSPSEVLKGVPEGQRNDTLFRYACRLNYQGLSEEEINVLVRQAAISCEPPLPEAETRSLIKSALKYKKGEKTLIDKKHTEIKLYTASELITAEFPEPKWAIPGILPEGLNILAGKPKIGKSIFALNVCIAVALGGKAFNKIDVEKGSVIYLALEDTPKRLQRRLRKIVAKGPAWIETDNLLIARSWPRMDDGGLKLLEEEIGKHRDLRLVIIDTLVKFRPAIVGKFINQYQIDYEHVSRIKDIADKYNISILLIHHRRKTEAEDVFDTFSGTPGLTGAADGQQALIRKKGRPELHITGRDIETTEYALEFNAREMCWSLLGKVEDVQSSIAKQEVYNVLQENDDILSPKELSELTGIEKHYVQKALGKLVAEGKITKEARGKYKGEGIKG